jgi:tetratricopeptide (TPR) repeat protein
LVRSKRVRIPGFPLLTLLCFFVIQATSIEAQELAYLFVSTNPINADVLLDGEPLEEKTPLLLRDLAVGQHSLEIRKQGYTTELREIQLTSGGIEAVDIELASLYFSPGLPEEEGLTIYGAEEEGGATLYQLPQGSYSFKRDEEGLHIDPVFPQDGWIRGLNLAAPLSLAFSAVLTLHDVFYPKRASVRITENLSLSPATLSAYGLTLTLISFDIVLYSQRNRAKQSFTYSAIPQEQALHSGKGYYARAENLLALGQLEEALSFYTRILEGYRDSPLYPYALFKTARIHFLTGADSMATIEFNLIADHYPQSDLYDKAQRSLADILLRQKAYRESIGELQAMVFADPLYTEEEIELLKAEILESWFTEDPTKVSEVIDAYKALVTRYPDSESTDLYRYKAAYYLYLGDRDAEAAELLVPIDPAGIDEDLGRKLRDLRRSLGVDE